MERLKNLGVISRIEFSEWACPVVYVKKKNNKIRVCADFSTGLNDCLRNNTYPFTIARRHICKNIFKIRFIRCLSPSESRGRMFKIVDYKYTQGFI